MCKTYREGYFTFPNGRHWLVFYFVGLWLLWYLIPVYVVVSMLELDDTANIASHQECFSTQNVHAN